MAKRKRKKNHWTTKNTHLQRKKKRDGRNKSEQLPLILVIIIILSIIGMFITWAFDTDRSGYDHFIGIPKEWIKWVK